MSRVDLVVLSLVSGAGAAGTYSVALGFADSLLILPQAAAAALAPVVAERSVGGVSDAWTLSKKVLIAQALLSVPFVLALAHVVRPSLGFGYDDLTLIGAMLAVANLALGAVRISTTVLTAQGHASVGTWVGIAVVVSMVSVGIVFASRWQARGMAVAAGLSYLVGLMTTSAAARRRSEVAPACSL